jgi:hypothetical protein
MATVYCNFATGSDATGDGSIGNPLKTIQASLNAVDISVFNVIAVLADELLTTPLVMPNTTAAGIMITGAEAAAMPVITSPGGITTASGIYWRMDYLKLVNGAAWTLTFLNTIKWTRCEIVVTGGVSSNGAQFIDCYIHGTGGTVGVNCNQIIRCVVDIAGVGVAPIGATTVTDCVVITPDTTRRGITGYQIAVGNTVVAPNGSSAPGLFGSEGNRSCRTSQNIVVGYAIGCDGGGVVTQNSFYNCATNLANASYSHLNETIESDPFADTINEDWTPRPIGALPEGGFSDWIDNLNFLTSRYRGAVQPLAAGGFPLSRLVN